MYFWGKMCISEDGTTNARIVFALSLRCTKICSNVNQPRTHQPSWPTRPTIFTRLTGVIITRHTRIVRFDMITAESAQFTWSSFCNTFTSCSFKAIFLILLKFIILLTTINCLFWVKSMEFFGLTKLADLKIYFLDTL